MATAIETTCINIEEGNELHLSTQKDRQSAYTFAKTLTGSSTVCGEDSNYSSPCGSMTLLPELESMPRLLGSVRTSLVKVADDLPQKGCAANVVQTSKSTPSLPSSVGSALHDVGNCKPCAWFWKSSGCSNGANCGHCHSCPPDAVKAYKKKKEKLAAAAKKLHKQAAVEKVASASKIVSPMRPPPGLEHLSELSRPTPSLEPSFEASGSDGDADSIDEDVQTDRGCHTSRDSIGSAYHASGNCKPCSWFWKTKGCKNGTKCLHCHLCPRGAVKLRRKQQVKLAVEQEADTEKQLMALQLEQVPIQQKLMEKQQSQLLNLSMRLEMQRQMMAKQALLTQAALALLATQPVVAAPLPSEGSALHRVSECKPCGWFWKPGGCQFGSACQYCHDCGPEEIKHRRKIKEARMKLS
eukprot:TRINITY_DN6002_c0_g1_i1.p1 TRINITY_DN6002_c0_g1~~TRINITY_DN6002_c0_g1_i1.p1  ORF type:complete len:411 (+),score=95.88 TRINITY_DN6002_c0_g1_i1:161-1393(+)